MHIQGMRHDRRPDHSGRQHHRADTVETRHQAVQDVGARRRRRDQPGIEAGGDDDQQAEDHQLEACEAVAVTNQQQGKGGDAGDDATDRQRPIEEQLECDCATDDLGNVGGHRDQLGLQPVSGARTRTEPLADERRQ